MRNQDTGYNWGKIMKRVVAVICEERFENVKEALLEKGYHGMNVS